MRPGGANPLPMSARFPTASPIVLAVVAAVLVLTVAPAHAVAPPGRTTFVSVGFGARPSSYSGRANVYPIDMTPDGSFVAFQSVAKYLALPDTNDEYDIFVRDLGAGRTELVSVSSDGEQGNAASQAPSLSADGRYVAFDSDATNLVTGDTNGVIDVFVHDRETGTTERVSRTSAGEQLDRNATEPRISGDGRFVAFASDATNLGPKTSTLCAEIYVHDRESGETERVSITPDGGSSRGACTYGSTVDLSADGRLVVFETQMHDLVDGDHNASWDIFVRDRQTDRTERVSIASDGEPGNYHSYTPRISADGRFVSFYSCASNLVPKDNNSSGANATSVLGSNTCFDVFVHDRLAHTTERVSISSKGDESNYGASWPHVSDDGRFVVFSSESSTFGEPSYGRRVWVHDRESGQTEWVSVESNGQMIEAGTDGASVISADGRRVAFEAFGDRVYVRDRGPQVGPGGVSAVRQADTLEVAGWARFGGTRIVSTTDPLGDGGPGSLGGDLTGASMSYRPEEGDLLIRFDVSDLSTTTVPIAATNYLVPAFSGVPGITHTLAFTLGGTRYEVRAQSASTQNLLAAQFDAWRCDPECSVVTSLPGAYGGMGTFISVSLPLAALGMQEGNALTALSATSATSDAFAGSANVLDTISLADTSIPRRTLALAVAEAGTSQGELIFDRELTPSGEFTTSLEVAGMPGDLDVWARACLGTECRLTRAEAT